MSLWRERLRPSDLQIMLPQLLLSLDRIRDQTLAPDRRLSMLRSLKDQVEAIQQGQLAFDHPDHSGTSQTVAQGLSLEQRLGRSWCNNLQCLLMEMGQPRYQGNARYAVFREWTLRRLIKGYSRVIESAALTDLPAPGGIWRSLHEMFLYLEGRDELDGTAIPVYLRLRPGDAYKRLLLIGSLAEYQHADRIYREIRTRLRDWAALSELTRMRCGMVDARHLRVDPGADAPPHRFGAETCEAVNAWTLRPPLDYCEALEHYALRDNLRTESV